MYISPNASKKLWRGLGKLFGGVKPEHLLSEGELDALRPIVKAHRSRFNKRAMPAVVLGVAALSWALIWLWPRVYGAPLNPILDDSSRLRPMAMVASLFIACVAATAPLEHRTVSRAMGDDAPLYECYVATIDNWTPARSAIALLVMVLPPAFLMLLCGWCMGTIVDDRGIQTAGFLRRPMHAYSDVAAVSVYQGFVAPIGPRMIPNVVVAFKDGDSFNYQPGNNATNLSAQIAEAVSTRSGVSIQYGQMRP